MDPARTFSANLGDLFVNVRTRRFTRSLLQAMISAILPEKVLVSVPVCVYAPELSISVIPERAPPVVTLNAVDVSEKSPLAFPMVVSLPETEERIVFPHEVRSVKIAVPGEERPIEVRLAAPVAEIFQLLSVKERLAEALPSVKLPE